MLAWASGTIFGREVVPEVCRMSATSSGFGGTGPGGGARSPSAGQPERAGAGLRLGSERNERDAKLLRRAKRGRFAARFDDQRLCFEILEIELELVLLIGGIERRRGRRGGHAEKRRRHFGSVRQNNRDPIAAADSEIVQRADRAFDQRAQACVGQRRRARARRSRPRRRGPDAMSPLKVRSALMSLSTPNGLERRKRQSAARCERPSRPRASSPHRRRQDAGSGH